MNTIATLQDNNRIYYYLKQKNINTRPRIIHTVHFYIKTKVDS